MKKNLIRRSSILAVLISLFMVILTACGSEATVEEVKDSEIVITEETVAKEEATVEVAEPAPVEEAEPEPEPPVEPTPEPTEEPMPEPVVYEGIDMESTLPAEEWTGTFLDIITEPKFIVTNSTTNKKVIVEEGQKVVLEEGDVLGVYMPDGAYVGGGGVNIIDIRGDVMWYCEFELDTFTEETVFEAKVSTEEGKKLITCILVPN